MALLVENLRETVYKVGLGMSKWNIFESEGLNGFEYDAAIVSVEEKLCGLICEICIFAPRCIHLCECSRVTH